MNADVIIIGAGIAGLRCGIKILHQSPSLNVVILEKYKYLGGRAVTYHKKLEDMEGRCATVQWENGAGRIHDQHINVMELVKKYNLTKEPLVGKIFYSENGILQENTFEESFRAILAELKHLPSEILANNTLRVLLWKTMGSTADDLLIEFPYRAEVDTLRADLAIHAFETEMSSFANYYHLKEGYSAIIQGMVKEFQGLGGKIFNKQEVTDIQTDQGVLFVRTKTDAGDVLWEAPKVICALHVDAIRQIPIFKSWKTLQYLKMEPLLRIYAVFPTTTGKSWFSGLERVVADNLVRYFIPMDPSCGVAMISYTDGKDARRIIRMLDEKGEDTVETAIMESLRAMFSEYTIPDPLFFKTHPWTSGCTYWLPGNYDPTKLSEEALHPFPDSHPGLYCCGESFSIHQAWMEGALEHADLLINKYFNK